MQDARPAMLAAVTLLSALAPPAAGQDAEGEVVEVTLYRGQALVTRRVPLPARAGEHEVVVPELPLAIVTDSLFAEGGEDVAVRAVRYRQRAVGEEPREEVRKLDAEIDEVADALAANQQNQQVVKKRLEHLDRLESFVAPTAHEDLSSGVLDAKALEKLVLFGFEQRQKASDDLLKLTREAEDLQARLALLKRRREEIQATSSRTVREAVIFLEKRSGGSGDLRLSYLVQRCGWSPTYTMRASHEEGSVQVAYNALIHQKTGEDWTGVQLTLSTATPALSAERPALAPFVVDLKGAQGQQEMQAGKAAALEQYQSIAKQQQEAWARNVNAVRLNENVGSAWDVNVASNAMQCFELTTGEDVLASIARNPAADAREPSLSYGLGVPVSLQSRDDQQMVRIARSELTAAIRWVATPVLSPHVYREAELENTTGHDLLGGPVTVYLDDRFVGRAEIGSVARGQTFVLGLGADPRLKTHRELADKTESTQGGNRLLTVKVRLTIESFRDGPVPVRLFDRLPEARDGDELRVTLEKSSSPLSEDPTYLRTDRPRGLLRWDLDVPAGSAGEDALAVTYTYTLEHARSLSITNPVGSRSTQLRQEFENLMRQRSGR